MKDEGQTEVLNPDWEPVLRSVLTDGRIYPAFIVPVNTDGLDTLVYSTRRDLIPYFPFRKVRPSESNSQNILASFDIFQEDSPENKVTLSVEVTIGSILTVISSMGEESMQIPFAIVSEDRFNEVGEDTLGDKDILFTTGLPTPKSEALIKVVAQLHQIINNEMVDSDDVDTEDVGTSFNFADLFTASRAFSYAHGISQGDSGIIASLLSQSELINDAKSISQDSDGSDTLADPEIFKRLPDIAYKAYCASLNAVVVDEDEGEEASDADQDFFAIVKTEVGLDRDILSSVSVEDHGLPVEIRRAKLIKTWDDSPLDSELSAIRSSVETLRKNEDFETYRDILDMDLSHKETFEHALDFYGATRLSIAMLLLIAQRANQYALLREMDSVADGSNVPMFNLLMWFDITHRSIMWAWLAMAQPLQNYDTSLSKDFFLLEQNVFKDVEMRPGEIPVPGNLIKMLETVLTSVLVLPTWQDYDFINLAADATHLGINIHDFDGFVDWLDAVITKARDSRDSHLNAAEAVREATMYAIQLKAPDMETLATWVSLMLPVLSEIHPLTSQYAIASEEWSESRKAFIINHLVQMIGGTLGN